MRDYLSPMRKALEKVVPHPAAVRSFVIKRRAFVFIMCASFVAIITLGYLSVHAALSPKSHENVVEQKGTNSHISTSITNSTQAPETPSVAPPSGSSNEQSRSSSDSKANTSVTINNQKIDVPANGTVQKTINNPDGTTNVTVTTNSGADGSSTTNSYVSTNTSTSSTSSVVSQDVTVQSP